MNKRAVLKILIAEDDMDFLALYDKSFPDGVLEFFKRIGPGMGQNNLKIRLITSIPS